MRKTFKIGECSKHPKIVIETYTLPNGELVYVYRGFGYNNELIDNEAFKSLDRLNNFLWNITTPYHADKITDYFKKRGE